mmetsp:Transcript_13583/g.22171  ORF Transcript_13583/g.22171 Transcript_13583/m.22171 type:complete len:726 (+) Transcript_13583:281-2458(+)
MDNAPKMSVMFDCEQQEESQQLQSGTSSCRPIEQNDRASKRISTGARVAEKLHAIFEHRPAQSTNPEPQHEDSDIKLKMGSEKHFMKQHRTSMKPELNVKLAEKATSAFAELDEETESYCRRMLGFMGRHKLSIFLMLVGSVLLVIGLVLLTNDGGDAKNGRRDMFMMSAVFFSLPAAILALLLLEISFVVCGWLFEYGLGFGVVSLIFYYYSMTKHTLRYLLGAIFAIISLEVLGRDADVGIHQVGSVWFTIRNLLIFIVTFLSTYMVGKILRIQFTQSFSSKSYSYRLLQSLHHEGALMILAGTNQSKSVFSSLYALILQEGYISDDPTEDNSLSPLVWQQLTNYVNARNVDGSFTKEKHYAKRFGRKLFHYVAMRSNNLKRCAERTEEAKKQQGHYDPAMTWPKGLDDHLPVARLTKHSKVFKQDLMRYKAAEFDSDYTLEVFWNEVLDPNERGYVTEYTFSKAVKDLFEQRKNLAASLENSRCVIKSLDNYIVGIAVFAVIVCALILYAVELQLIVAMSSTLVGFAFVFGNSMKNSFDAIVYLFVIRPYDLGDMLLVDDVRFHVQSINLMATVMIRWDGMLHTFEHRLLADKDIINLSRSKKYSQFEEFLVDMHIVDENYIKGVERDIRAWLAKYPASYSGTFDIYVLNIEEPLKCRLGLCVEYNYRKADYGRFFADQSRLNLAYMNILRKHGISYSGCKPGRISMTEHASTEFNSPWIQY